MDESSAIHLPQPHTEIIYRHGTEPLVGLVLVLALVLAFVATSLK